MSFITLVLRTYSIDFLFYCFFFNDTATTEIYTLSLHDALPRYRGQIGDLTVRIGGASAIRSDVQATIDRKSTRLNSSHTVISYAVFCLKKKKKKNNNIKKKKKKIKKKK